MNIKGITLVALVVTIVVLLILAGITINLVLSDDGIFKKAEDVSFKADIAKYKEMLETAKSSIIIECLGSFESNKYFEELEKQGIMQDVINNGDGTYEVTTKPGYVFEVKLIPNKEKPSNAIIEYIGEKGKLPPRIKNIELINKTEESLDIKVEVTRLEDGKLSYYYKEVDEPETEYKEVKKDVTDLTATIGNLTTGRIYHVKVVIKNKNGKNELVITEAIQQLVKKITLNKTTEVVGKNDSLQLIANALPESAENKILQWSSSDENIATVDETGLVTTKANGSVIIKVSSTDGGNVEENCNILVKTLVTDITLNKSKEEINIEETLQLVATVKPSDADDKTVTWSSSNEEVATVNQNGLVTAMKEDGVAIITATANDESKKTATCTVSVVDMWARINKIAREIASNDKITSSSTSATATVEGMTYTLKVGDIYELECNNKIYKVRIIGFKHDDLTYKNVYGGNHTKAGITFCFVNAMETNHVMAGGATNSGGWIKCSMRTFLNEVQGKQKLSNGEYIKQVKKSYIVTNNVASVSTSNDDLWLLSCAEIWNDGYTTGTAGAAITKEGSQYQWYKTATAGKKYNSSNTMLIGRNVNGTANSWWLRSPHYSNGEQYICIGKDGAGTWNKANVNQYVIPGFCI